MEFEFKKEPYFTSFSNYYSANKDNEAMEREINILSRNNGN